MSVNDDIQIGVISESLNGKIDLPDNKNQSDVRIVIETYSNGSSWYRVYSDGWCEQGGNTSGTSDALVTVNFVKGYSGIPEILTTRQAATITTGGTINHRYDAVQNVGTDSFQCWGIYASAPLQWCASGYVS